jgi:hypothetical protein
MIMISVCRHEQSYVRLVYQSPLSIAFCRRSLERKGGGSPRPCSNRLPRGGHGPLSYTNVISPKRRNGIETRRVDNKMASCSFYHSILCRPTIVLVSGMVIDWEA